MRTLLLLLALVAVDAAERATKRVIVMVIDGPRQTEMWADPAHAHIPHLAGELCRQGVVLPNFRNDGPTYTNAGHAAITTGLYQEIENSGKELPRAPGLFQRWLERSGAKPEDAWVVASKDKLDILADCRDPAYHGRFRPMTDCGRAGNGSGYRDDDQTEAHLLAILERHQPHLVLVNYQEPDASGHGNDWAGYLRGIEAGDARAARLWAWIQSHPPFAGETALFITHDHGRHLDGHADGFVSHGDDCEGCRRILLVALGPDFPQGLVSPRPRGQIDLAATCAALLGITLPGGTGAVIDELFRP